MWNTVILNSVVSFTLSPQETYANEVSLPVYIWTSDTHDIHTNAVLSYLFGTENYKGSEESVSSKPKMCEEKCITWSIRTYKLRFCCCYEGVYTERSVVGCLCSFNGETGNSSKCVWRSVFKETITHAEIGFITCSELNLRFFLNKKYGVC